MYKILKMYLCIVILFNIARCTYASTQSDATEVLNSAIVTNFMNEYGEMGTIPPEKFRSFVERALRSDKHLEHPLSLETGKDAHIFKVLKACSDVTNLTACQEFLSEHCIDREMLLGLFSGAEVDNNTLADVFPALVFHMQSQVCRLGYDDHEGALLRDGKPTSTQTWGYGIACVGFLVFISNIGGCLGPFMQAKFFQRMLMFCVALAAGTLGCTGIMVLLPESLGLTGADSPIPDYHYKSATAIGGIYFFYLSERFMKLYMKKGTKKPKSADGELLDVTIIADPPLPIDDGKGKHSHLPMDTIDEIDDIKGGDKKNKAKKEVATVAWMILIGDGLHNFVDGMSIGAAFTQNVLTGFSVFLAITCEELPHELGDIAILLHSGLSMKRALFYNFMAALTAVLGLAVGIVLGENTNAATWIFAIAAGMFVYISLVDMVPEMDTQAKNVIEKGIESPRMTLAIQNIGLITGFIIIMMLCQYGGNIDVQSE